MCIVGTRDFQKDEKGMNIYILVLVKRGCIQEPEIFFDYHDAERRKRKLLRNFSRDYDEIDIFLKEISEADFHFKKDFSIPNLQRTN